MKFLSLTFKIFLFLIIFISFLTFFFQKNVSVNSKEIASHFYSLQETVPETHFQQEVVTTGQDIVQTNQKKIDIHKWGKNVSFKVLGGSIFEFIAEIIVESLQELGFNATRGGNIDLEDDETIYIQTWTFSLPFSKKNKFIIYNWEQLRPSRMFTAHPDMLIKFHQAVEVWDYSLDNINYAATFGIKSKLIIPGFSSKSHNQTLALEQTPKERSNIVGFSGTLNDRREEKLHDIALANITILETPSFASLSDCKIVLNIHSHIGNEAILEIHRFIQLIPLKSFILSEKGGDSFLDTLFSPFVSFFDSTSDAVNQINAIFDMDHDEYEQVLTTRLESFKKRIPSFKYQLLHSDSWVWEPGFVQLSSTFEG